MRNILIIVFFTFLLGSCNKHFLKTEGDPTIVLNNDPDFNLDYQYTFTEATKQSLLGDLNQAILLYRKCIQLDSTQSTPYYQIANILFKSGEHQDALAFAKKGYQYDQNNKWLNMLLVDLYRLNKQFENALSVVNSMVEKDSNNVEYIFTQAALYNELGKTKKALQILSTIEERFGISEQVSLTKYNIYNSDDNISSAESELLSLIDAYPDEIRFYGILAEFYSEHNMNDQALALYNKLMLEDGENIYVILSAAEHFKKVKQFDKAFEYYRKALNSADIDGNEQIRVLIGLITDAQFFQQKHLELGRLINTLLEKNPENDRLRTLRADFYMRVKNFDGARDDLIRVLEKNKNNYVIWEQLLFILNAQSNHSELKKYSAEAIRYIPEQPTFYMFKGLAEMQLNENALALKTFKKGLDITKDNRELKIQFLSLLGDVSRNLGDHKQSDDYFEQVLKLDPENILVLNNYSYYLSLRKENLSRAEKMSRKTIETDPDNATYLDTYAWILYELGQIEKAFKYITRAIENGGGTNPEILMHYAEILIKLKRTDDAVKAFQQAILHGGDETEISNRLREVNE